MGENKIKYEITCGPLTTPEKGEIQIPPDGCIRKDIEMGDLVISVKVTTKSMQKKVENAKANGKTEIEVELEERTNDEEGR